jgi:hypothetical protein
VLGSNSWWLIDTVSLSSGRRLEGLVSVTMSTVASTEPRNDYTA